MADGVVTPGTLRASVRPLVCSAAWLCFYAALALWWLRPVGWHPSDQIPGASASSLSGRLTLSDEYLTLWVLAAGAQQAIRNPSRLFHPPVFYPEPYALAFSEHMLGQQVLFGPAYLATGNAVLSLDLSLLLSAALLGLGTHLLVRRWGGGTAAAILAASLVLAAPWRTGASAARVHTLWVHWLPFVLLFFDRYLAERKRTDLGLGCLCLLLQILTSYYDGYAAVGLLALYLIPRARFAPAAVLRAAAGALTAVALAAACSYPYLLLARAGVVDTNPLVAATVLFSALGAPAVLTRNGVGILPLAGTLLLAIPWCRRGGGLHRAPWRTLLAASAAGYVLAIGPALPIGRSLGLAMELLWRFVTAGDRDALIGILARHQADLHLVPTPYAVLGALVPGFDRLRAPFRFGVLPATLLPITCALAVERVGALLGAARWVPALVLSAFALGRMPPVTPAPVEVEPDIPPAYRWLREHGAGRPVLEAPYRTSVLTPVEYYDETRAMYFSTYHSLPLLNGYSGHMPASFVERRRIAARLPEAEALATLCAETGLGWILLHGPASRAWDPPPDALRVAARFGTDVVFQVTCAAGSQSTRSKMR